MLQTGAKNYGGHNGPVISPAVESDPRILVEPNFYYVQEDILFDYCAKNNVPWNVIRPAFILGAVEDAAMNSVYSLAIYAAIQKYKGEKLVWPGDAAGYDREIVQSTAMLNSYLSEYVAVTEKTANQAFNALDASPFTYARLWPELAKWYGLDFAYPENDTTGFQKITMPYPKLRG